MHQKRWLNGIIHINCSRDGCKPEQPYISKVSKDYVHMSWAPDKICLSMIAPHPFITTGPGDRQSPPLP